MSDTLLAPANIDALVTIDPWTGEVVGMLPEPIHIPIERLAEAFHIHDARTREPLGPGTCPATRAMQEGEVDMVVLWLEPGQPDRYLRCEARCTYDEDFEPVSVTVRTTEVAGLQRVGVEDHVTLLVCPCGEWTLDLDGISPKAAVARVLLHSRSCPTLALARL